MITIDLHYFRPNLQTDEDEETRAYRLEIEKQKALREKILRDKEMRRRKAAEDIRKEDVRSNSILFQNLKKTKLEIIFSFHSNRIKNHSKRPHKS